MRLKVDHVSWSVDGKPILRDVSLAVEPGSITGLIGPNGSGKSTLLRCIYRALKPDSGSITLDGDDLVRMDSRETARRVAVVLQEYPSDFQFTVGEIVSMGRNPHKGMFDRDTPADRGIIRDSLARVGLAGFSHRNFNTLSGGEKQRVIIARTVAQQASFLVLDEPTNHLDIRYQLETMELVRGLGLTTLAALHDMNIAADYCDLIHVMAEGRIVASGDAAGSPAIRYYRGSLPGGRLGGSRPPDREAPRQLLPQGPCPHGGCVRPFLLKPPVPSRQ